MHSVELWYLKHQVIQLKEGLRQQAHE